SRCCRCGSSAGAAEPGRRSGKANSKASGKASGMTDSAPDFADRQVVVTGGTGALGAAVVGALLGRGARCLVPYRRAADAERFAHRGDRRVTLVEAGDLADEPAAALLYDGIGALWASIHLAGGFAMAPI